jgi:hypothetical protein
MGPENAPDVTVLVRGKKFFLHKAFLSSRSPYFNFLFEHSQFLTTTNVELDESFSKESFSDKNMQDAFTMLVNYLYSGDKRGLKCYGNERLNSTLATLVDFLQVNGVETNEKRHHHFTRFNPNLHGW